MKKAGTRLVQATFHNRSLSLYANMGFDIREPISCVQGRTQERQVPGGEVRPVRNTELDACNALSRRVHGFDRALEREASLTQGSAVWSSATDRSPATPPHGRSSAMPRRRPSWLWRP